MMSQSQKRSLVASLRRSTRPMKDHVTFAHEPDLLILANQVRNDVNILIRGLTNGGAA